MGGAALRANSGRFRRSSGIAAALAACLPHRGVAAESGPLPFRTGAGGANLRAPAGPGRHTAAEGVTPGDHAMQAATAGHCARRCIPPSLLLHHCSFLWLCGHATDANAAYDASTTAILAFPFIACCIYYIIKYCDGTKRLRKKLIIL